MRKLSFLVFIISFTLGAQSQHGKDLKLDCSLCHKSDTWKITDSTGFDHNGTAFKLTGGHKQVNCRQCHATLVFSEAKTTCNSCHRDMHKGSVTPECAKCHTPANWLVTNTNKLHQTTRFPLLGIHAQADCQSCHSEYSTLNFSVIGVSCYECHANDFQATQNPNHLTAGFDKNCQSCHSVSADSWRSQSFKHDFFPLTGMHKLDNCYACHNKTTFSGLSNQCYSCHEKDYKATTNPNHLLQSFSTQCQVCHTINGWKPAQFDHNKTNFPLTGAHNSVTCSNCHVTPGLKPSTDCYVCHKTKYEQATDPNHIVSGLGQTCTTCHTTTSWKPSSFNHSSTGFTLTGAHVSANCSKCHITAGVKPLQDCYACHRVNYEQTVSPNHVTSNFAKTCYTCHTTTAWKPANFDHNTTAFPLTGAHLSANCSQCHITAGVTPSTDCYACHKTKYDQTTNPNHAASGFDKTCKTCHSTGAWKPATFNHDGLYFPIYSGEHKGKWNTCADCHKNTTNYAVFSCIDCHEHNKTDMDKEHKSVSGYSYASTACLSCHPNGKGDGAFNHQTSNFPLTGSHVTAACQDCHVTGYSTAPATDCKSCHAVQSVPASAPNHALSGFSSACKDCHNTISFTQTTFNHSTGTQFPLQGAHVSATCKACHVTQYTPTTKVCKDCHQDDLQSAASVNHTLAGFNQPCSQCHTETAWKPAQYTHPASFALTGKHTTATCDKCHATQFANTPKECKGCHINDFNQATNPNHSSTGFSQICQDCHTTTKWQGATLNHDPKFPIYSGKHNGKWQLCSECHTNNNYNDYTCISCHEHNQTATNQEHATVSGYVYSSHECKACHPTGSESGSFNHAQSTFPLTGAHLASQCNECHVGGYSVKPSTECKVCHQDDLTPVTNPDHKVGNFSQVCTNCHNTSKWKPSTFNHTTGTQFALQGAHINAACNTCHATQYTNTTKVCKDCHQDDLQASVSVNHTLAGFTQPCSQCHTATAWKPAQYTHPATFALTGKHISTSCEKCHATQYTNTPKECKGCHINDFNQTTNPNHTGAGFSQICQDCHTTTKWQGATFNHDPKFPVYSGKHKGKWQLCSECHANNNFNDFTCISCHEHNKPSTDQEHTGVSGYIYSSHECFACHPTGSENGSFNHAQSVFPLTGAHLATQCNQCHINGYTVKPSTECKVCHNSSLATVTNPNHSLGNFPQVCTNCHTTGKWKPATFNHTTGTQFPLQGAHVSATCNNCHVAQYATTSKICKDCHNTAFQQSTNPNHTLAAFTQPCEQCHTATAWSPSTYNHTVTGYSLVGKHITTACNKCHATQYANTPTDCFSCHTVAYNSTTLPNHAASNISTDCKTCHTPASWTATLQFTQHDASLFPIYSGEHRNKWTKCTDCHRVATNYNTFSCIDCHEHNQASMNSEHQNVTGYVYQSAQCFNCHPRGTSVNAFNHATGTFPLNGAHLAVSCNSCHQSGYAGTPTACNACHQTSYNNTQNPNHQATGIATACSTCHSTTAWTPSSFNHTSTTFPLTGMHITTACGSCHIGATTGTSQLCKSCHLQKFQATTNPSHVALNISQECQTCHTTNAAWKPATFATHANFWPFQGAHVAIKDNCVQCHNNNYTTTHTCYTCHQAKFTATVSPPHVQYNISQVCSTCHTQSAWTPATFNHSFYPISNKHRNVTCKQCHSLSGYNPQCITCHQDDYQDGHNGVGHPNCYQCHNTSDFDDKKFQKTLDKEK